MRKIVIIALPVTGVDGFQDLQAITLGCGNEFRLMFRFELILAVIFAFTEVVDTEWIVFQLNTKVAR